MSGSLIPVLAIFRIISIVSATLVFHHLQHLPLFHIDLIITNSELTTFLPPRTFDAIIVQ